jgi:hypothetical protein
LIYGGSATALLAFKVSAKNGLFLGQTPWVKLVLLEARIRPVEQLDKRPPWKAEGRTM